MFTTVPRPTRLLPAPALPKRLSKLVWAACAATLTVACASAPPPGPDVSARPVQTASVLDPQAPLPVDPGVVMGTLDNGLTYYIEANREPAARAELRLIVRAGSVLEDDDQLGLAHVVEHMAFNGTRRFAGTELVQVLEGMGLRFGAHLNASTGFDETVYQLQVPTDRPELLEQGLVVLSEWAGGLTFDPQEVEKERGVVLEEWRRSRGAGGRLRDGLMPLTFHGSRYAERLPIGTEASLRGFTRDQLVRFYRDWYRPSLMAVVAVGDFEPAAVEELIRGHFSGLQEPAQPRPRPQPSIPDHDQTLYGVFSDPEVSHTTVSILCKRDDVEGTTVGDYRAMIVERLGEMILNERFAELARDPKAPIVGAGAGKQRLTPTEGALSVGAGVKEGRIEEALDLLVTEVRRAAELGFTAAELDRAARATRRQMQSYLDERHSIPSAMHAQELVRVFTTGEAMPGIEKEHELTEAILSEVTLEEVNAVARRHLQPHSRVINVVAPQKEGAELPTRERLAAVVAAATQRPLAAPVEEVVERPLMSELPTPGRIVSRRVIEEVGVSEWTLANGVRVLLKPTDFRADEVLLRAISWGGTAQAADADVVAASSATSIAALSGVGDFDALALRKALAGRKVGVSTWVTEQEEGMSGHGSREDLERLFQLAYLSFTSPRLDPKGLQLYHGSQAEALRNRMRNPGTHMADEITRQMWQDFPRYRPWTVETLEQLDLEKSRRFLARRFADAGDFTFFLVGSFTLEEIEPHVVRYLGGLPGQHALREGPTDLGARRPEGVVESTVREGIDPQSSVYLALHGSFHNTRENRYLLDSLADVLSVRLREELREEQGGTYSVSADASIREQPVSDYAITIRFQADPDRAAALTQKALEIVEAMRAAPVAPRYVAQLQEQQRRARETAVRTNGFWLGILSAYDRRGDDLRSILAYDELVESLTPARLHEAARTWLDPSRRVQVTLLPEAVAAR